MPLDPQCKGFLDILAGAGGKPIEELPPEEARQVSGGMINFAGPEPHVAKVENRSIPGPAQPIPIRVYWPSLDDRLPALVFFHGGGFVLCDLDSHDRLCRSLANESGCVVVSVGYRLAPEHKFPAAPDDAYAATCYVAAHASEFGIDPGRIAVGGDSAGGNLATVVALMSRDRQGPSLRFQLLIYPVTDFYDESPSMHDYGKDHFLTRDAMNWFLKQYFSSAADARLPYASPMNADVRGLPPAMIITAECDPVRDQGEAYAEKLRRAGVSVELKRYEGMVHPFFSLGGIVDAARTATKDAASAIEQALAPAASAGSGR